MEKKEKKLGLFSLVSFLVSGIVVLDTFVAPAALGASSITLWVIVSVLFMIPNGFINAELGGAYPEGLGVWVKKSMGDFHATIATWFYWVNVSFWMPAVFITFTYWFSMTYFPDGKGGTTLHAYTMMAIAVAVCWILVLTVRRGIDLGVTISKVAAVTKIVVLFIFGALGVVYASKNGVSEVFVDANWIPSIADFSSLALVTAIVFNLLGFELIASIGDKVKNAGKTIPRSVAVAAVFIGALYIFGTYGVLQAATKADLADESFILNGFVLAMKELTTVFGTSGPIVFKITIGAALFTLVANMISWVIGASEIIEDAEFSRLYKVFHERHPKYGTLSKSYTLMGIIATILVVIGMGFGESGGEVFWTLLAFSMVIFIYPYIYLTPAVLKLRKKDGVESRQFAIPGGKFGIWVSAILNFIFITAAIALLAINPGYDLYYPVVGIGTVITTLVGVWFYYKGKKLT